MQHKTSLFQLRQPAFWLYAFLMVVTFLFTLSQQSVFRQISAQGWALAWLLVLLYALPLIVLMYVLDLFEREPLSLIAGALFWGAIAATSLAGIANQGWALVVARVGGPDFASQWTAALTAPFVEETLKIIGVVMIYLIARREIDDSMDGFVYGAMVGLGFAVVEDVFYFMGVFGGQPAGVLQGFFLRVAASGLYGHVLYTGIAGIGIAYFVSRKDLVSRAQRVLVAGGLFAVAAGAHLLWNSPWMDFFPVRPWTGADWLVLPFAAAVKGAPFLGFVAVLIFLSRRREQRWLRIGGTTEVGKPGLLAAEFDDMSHPGARRRARMQMRARAGAGAAGLLKRLQHEQVNLAMLATRASGDDDVPELVRQREFCKSLRDALEAIPGAARAA
jgi:RsiW-degrading membrane proteinase PrsW (M82 family)